jgi:hypothetical protein
LTEEEGRSGGGVTANLTFNFAKTTSGANGICPVAWKAL